MELLALVLINIVFGVILYYAVSIKVTNSVRDYQIVKLKKEIQAHTLSFFKESESYLALMDSRIAVLKNLLQKAESKGINFNDIPDINNSSSNSSSFSEEKSQGNSQSAYSKTGKLTEQILENELIEKKKNSQSKSIPQNLSKDDSAVGGFIAGLGKGLKSMFGVTDEVFSDFQSEPSSKSGKNSVIDVSIGGNPLISDEIVRDNTKADTGFQAALAEANSPYSQTPKPKDKVAISISAVLEELPADATKVEKVVHLLKKGYSHSEISDEMGLAIPEVSLIETIKIERSRRI